MGYCGSEDLGLDWQHGDALITFKKYRLLGGRLQHLRYRRCAPCFANEWRSPAGSPIKIRRRR